MSRLLVFAHPLEAAATIEELRAEKCEQGYRFDDGLLIICGIGPIAAAAATAAHAADYDEVWNMGCAGSLGELALYDLVEVGSVEQRLFHDCSEQAQQFAADHQPIIDLGEGPRLLTTNTPLDHRLPGADLVDMEGYGVAYAARRAGKAVRLIKVVSDLASGEPIPPQLERCALTLAELI